MKEKINKSSVYQTDSGLGHWKKRYLSAGCVLFMGLHLLHPASGVQETGREEPYLL